MTIEECSRVVDKEKCKTSYLFSEIASSKRGFSSLTIFRSSKNIQNDPKNVSRVFTCCLAIVVVVVAFSYVSFVFNFSIKLFLFIDGRLRGDAGARGLKLIKLFSRGDQQQWNEKKINSFSIRRRAIDSPRRFLNNHLFSIRCGGLRASTFYCVFSSALPVTSLLRPPM